jgi:protein-L-isoaspartate O-methyltransferase
MIEMSALDTYQFVKALIPHPGQKILEVGCGNGYLSLEHASHNVAKTVLDWEYTREILRIHLRALSHEGSLSQDRGASHVTIATQSKEASGGHGHV